MQLLPAVPADVASQFSWWQREMRESFPQDAAQGLSGQVSADVVIVGGGFTGLWTAFILKERHPELDVVILDSYRCGDGASSRNGGNVHGYWSALPTLLSLFGPDKCVEIARLGTTAQERLRKLAAAKGLDVWWTEKGYLRVATSAYQSIKLRQYLSTARLLGIESTLRHLRKEEVAAYCDSPRFDEALLFEEGATVHPARLCRKLRDAVVQAGVRIFEQTPVTSIAKGSPCLVTTAGGALSARDVVLATYTGTMSIPDVARGTSLFSSFPVMSEPAPELLARMNYAQARGIADLRMFTHYFRRTPDGRILMGSGSGPLEKGCTHAAAQLRDDAASLRRAEVGLQRFFPDLGSGIAARWGFPIEVTSDRIPCFGTIPGTRIHYGSGYSGHGVNATVIAGECLASLVLDTKDKWSTSPFCRRDRLAFPPEPFRYWGGRAIRNAIVACEDAEDARRPAPFLARALAAAPGYLGLKIGTR